MNRKVGIITIPDYNNYGNRLQNYAVKMVFHKLGFTTVDSLEINDISFKLYKARKYKLLLKKYNLKPIIFLFNIFKGGFSYARRDAYFEQFTREFLSTKFYPHYNSKTLSEINTEYDYFVFGSDQIWNPYINDSPNLYFGLFTDASKRIFYAPSFGVNRINSEYSRIVFNALQNVESISVREESGKTIIQHILNKPAEVLIDPTLMLNASEWTQIAKAPKKDIQGPYILSCFLGPKSCEYTSIMENVMTVIGCNSIYSIAEKSTTGYLTGPSEFVYSIQNAKFVITDSFHATVFAILFNKPFLVLSRLDANGNNAQMDSRIDTLLMKFGLIDRKYTGQTIDYMNCDFSSIDAILSKERQRTINFIEKIILKRENLDY